ncbi:hypothetical protein [Thermus tenuipuniceus]|uniref:hypothetical protein n=1 Tax=Thermus tenuipuniceus TaxID=2078690 RepID=UPI0013E3DDB7|nr:hypothetical protein [Thermus tenuipuniceus]
MLYDPEARKDLKEELLWLWEETRMALVALGRAREVLEALEEEDRILGDLFASEPREGHRVLEEFLAEVLGRLRRAERRAGEVFGLFLDPGGGGWARRGGRPKAVVAHRYRWFYLCTFVEPETGEAFSLLVDGVETGVMSWALREFRGWLGEEEGEVWVVLDRAGWHVGLGSPDGGGGEAVVGAAGGPGASQEAHPLPLVARGEGFSVKGYEHNKKQEEVGGGGR